MNTTAFFPTSRAILAILFTMTFFSGILFSQTVTNGSFTNVEGNSVTPAGWTNTPGNNPGPMVDPFPSVDVLSTSFSSYTGSSVVAASPSPNGGTWVGLSSLWDMENEAIEQVVPGFVVGQTYLVSLWVANFGGPSFDDAGTVTIYVNDVPVVTSPVLDLVANVWTQISGTFVATSTSMTVQIDTYHDTDPLTGSGYYSADGLTIVPGCDAGGLPIFNQTLFCLSQNTFDLGGLTPSNTPATSVITWHSSTPVSSATQLSSISNVQYGDYYASFYNATDNCYGPSQIVSIHPNPVAGFTNVGSCAGTSFSFTDTSSVFSGTLTNWLWNFGDGQTSSAENPSHAFSTADSYNVSLVVTSDAGCTDSIMNVVVVNPIPSVTFLPTQFCENVPTQFNNTSTVTPGTFTSWNWTFGDGATSLVQNPEHGFAQAGNYSVTLVGLTAAGCSNSQTQNITIYASPIANFSENSFCPGIAVDFIDSTSIPVGTVNGWTWNFGDGSTSSLQNPTHQFGEITSSSVSLIVVSDQGCTNTIVNVIEFDGAIDLQMPNVITANNDGINDFLLIDEAYQNCYQFELMLFNRWGQVVYTMKNDQPAFSGIDKSGNTLEDGVYFYKLISNYDEKDGFVTIVR